MEDLQTKNERGKENILSSDYENTMSKSYVKNYLRRKYDPYQKQKGIISYFANIAAF